MIMDTTFTYAKFIKETNYEALPKEVVESTKKFVLDTVGCIIAGSSAPGCPDIVDEIKQWGGREDSSILIHGGKVPAHHATFVNSVMANALDLDETHDKSSNHVYNATLSAALALAEMKGGISGKEFITAVTLGVDISCRIGSACVNFYGWQPAAVYSVFGAAATASKILKLSEQEIINTFGIAYSQTGGSFQSNIDAALVKRMQPGLNARGAVMGSFMAKRGISGPQNVLEGQYGFFNLYQRGTYNPKELTDDLGIRFEGVNCSIKPYPCCRCNHAAIDAALEIANNNNIDQENIDHIDVHVTAHCHRVVGRPFKLQLIQGTPQVYAQFCLPYTVTASLLRKDLFISDFDDKAIRDPKIEEIAQKVNVVPDEDVSPSTPTVMKLSPATVRVTMKSGKVFSKQIDIPKGDPRNPMSFEEVIGKVKKCLPYSFYSIDERKINEGIEMIGELEKVDDIRRIIANFSK